MSNSSTALRRPFSDSDLHAYSAEHVAYEFDMLLWLVGVFRGPTLTLAAPTPADVVQLQNVLVEGFALHLRNVLDFLFNDRPQASDVVAADFFAAAAWTSLRPPLSATLGAARVRANKEIAHLTTLRKTGSPPDKAWHFATLANEVRPVMRLFADNAPASRLSPRVASVIR